MKKSFAVSYLGEGGLGQLARHLYGVFGLVPIPRVLLVLAVGRAVASSFEIAGRMERQSHLLIMLEGFVRLERELL